MYKITGRRWVSVIDIFYIVRQKCNFLVKLADLMHMITHLPFLVKSEKFPGGPHLQTLDPCESHVPYLRVTPLDTTTGSEDIEYLAELIDIKEMFPEVICKTNLFLVGIHQCEKRSPQQALPVH